MIARKGPINQGPAPGGAGAPSPGPIRAAVYCRQSVERETANDFGSIQNQRETGEAYVTTQREHKWIALPKHYDDLGVSGATTQRPAFQMMLTDIEAGQIDAVIVYRLDRLTRSTADLFRLMEFFQKHGTTFVSVSESFNTQTPMGRFALSILGVVSQLEREVTSLRIKDTVAAARRRGLWTGGQPPLGLDSVDGKLVINAREAEAVRAIVATYLETGSLTGTLEVLADREIVAKGGLPFRAATLRSLLHSPLIGGRINAGGTAVVAQHKAILDEPTWTALQTALARPEKPARRHRRTRSAALLAGLLRCGVCGASMSSHWTGKENGRRYQAYVCQTIIQKGASACRGSRAPAGPIEAAVVEQIMAIGRNPALITEALAAARSELAARDPTLAAELRRLNGERNRLAVERAHIVEAIATGSGTPALLQKLAELDAALTQVAASLTEGKAQRAALKGITIDEGEIRAALATFTPVWASLFPKERARILNLLIEVVRVNVPTGDVEIVFKSEGVRVLARDSQPTPA